MCRFSCHYATQCPINTSLTTMSHAKKRGSPMGHRRHTSLQPVRWRPTQSPPSSPNRQPPFTLRSRLEFRFVVPVRSSAFRRSFVVRAAIGNLHHPNVWFCLVLSGLFKAPTIFAIKILFYQDLQQIPSRRRPDIPDIRPAARPLRYPLSAIRYSSTSGFLPLRSRTHWVILSDYLI